jgi:GT2 family glycosyltransferase
MTPQHHGRRVGIVIATRDRRDCLLRTLEHLLALPERVPVVVVDNGSADGTPEAVRRAHPTVQVVKAGANLGAGARTVGARTLDTPYVAFSDDDSWWAPDALRRAAAILDAVPSLGLLAARVLVGPEERGDPVCELMADSPLPGPAGVRGRGVLGFIACGAIVRREAFLAVGGFDQRYGIGGEEQRLALDLAAAGWQLAYVPEVVAHHHPDVGHQRRGRMATQIRNDLWSCWLRRPAWPAARHTVRLLRRSLAERPAAAADGLRQAVAGVGWVARERRPVPTAVERALEAVEAQAR